jgi:hypothetical protein
LIKDADQMKLEMVKERAELEKIKTTFFENDSKINVKINEQSSEEETNKIILPIKEPTDSPTAQLELEIMELKLKNDQLCQQLTHFNEIKHQIQSDSDAIKDKNSQIKHLNNKISLLEAGKSPPDCLKQIKQLKMQLKQMENLLVKNRNNTNKEKVHQSGTVIDFYENKIKETEIELNEKMAQLERDNRIWQQKYYLTRQIYEDHMNSLTTTNPSDNNIESDQTTSNIVITENIVNQNQTLKRKTFKKIDSFQLESKLNEIEQVYMRKIEQFKAMIDRKDLIIEQEELNSLKLKQELETTLAIYRDDLKKKQTEIELINDKIIRDSLERTHSNERCLYEPKTFEDKIISDTSKTTCLGCKKSGDSSSLILSNTLLNEEINSLKKELKSRSIEYEQLVNKQKKFFENELSQMKKKYEYDIKKLIKLLTDDDIDDFMFEDYDSPLDDLNQLKNLKKSSAKHRQAMIKINEQNDAIKSLKNDLIEFEQIKNENSKIKQEKEQLKLSLINLKGELKEAKRK